MGMTAEEFRRRRLAERRSENGTSSMQNNASEGRMVQPTDILSDMGTGDMFGGDGVWTPPVTNGYRCEALARLRGRITHSRMIQSRFITERRWETHYN